MKWFKVQEFNSKALDDNESGTDDKAQPDNEVSDKGISYYPDAR